MHGLVLLQDLAIVMLVAGLVTVVFHRLRQPVVLGYILAGVLIGPYSSAAQLVSDKESIKTLAELGMVLLMFSLGLHFSLRKLAKVGSTAFVAGTFEILLMLLLGYRVGRLFGWSQMDSLFLGPILSISSTTIIVKTLGDLGRSKQKSTQLVFGILIVEDILAITMMALLPSIALTGALQTGDVLVTVGKLGIFLAVVLVAGLLIVPPLLRHVGSFKNNEMLLVVVLGLCFGVSLLAYRLDYSIALGAFLIGAIIGEAREIGRIQTLIEPVRDVFSAVFFVAIGMQIDPSLLAQHTVAIVLAAAAVIVGKVLTCSTGALVAGHDTKTSLRVGMSMAQIGEFSFIIAQLGLTLKVTSDFLYPIAVAVSAITTLCTPYLIRSSDPLVEWFDRTAPRSLVDYLQLYSNWVRNLGVRPSGSRDQIRRLMRRWTLQIGLNMALISGLLIAGAWSGRHAGNWLPALPGWTGGARAIAWFATIVLVLPLLVACLRKLRAISMVIAELKVTSAVAREQTAAIRMVVANTILGASLFGIILWILLLTATILPPWPVLAVMCGVIVAIAAVLWRSFIKVYARAQIALHDALSQPIPETADEPGPISPLLQSAHLETIILPAGSASSGQLIRELQLRTRTGASIVGIQRGDQNIINPSPDDDLQVNDSVLLIGSREHLAAAKALLLAGSAS